VREHLTGPVNHPHEEIYQQIRSNIRRQLPQIQQFPPNDYKVMLLCGGPTLNDHVEEIKRKRQQGWKIITVNGTHNWCLDHGLEPSMCVVMDARPINKGFVEEPVKNCRYMLCSQTHGDIFDALKGHDVWVWHGGAPSSIEKRILDRYYRKRWLIVPGGTSVGPRAIFLSYILGIRRLDVYGLDGCLRKDRHHAYAQKQNNYREVLVVKVGRRKFHMHAWMLKQFDEWLQMVPMIPDDLKTTVKGTGAMAHVVEYAASHKRPPPMEVLTKLDMETR